MKTCLKKNYSPDTRCWDTTLKSGNKQPQTKINRIIPNALWKEAKIPFLQIWKKNPYTPYKLYNLCNFIFWPPFLPHFESWSSVFRSIHNRECPCSVECECSAECECPLSVTVPYLVYTQQRVTMFTASVTPPGAHPQLFLLAVFNLYSFFNSPLSSSSSIRQGHRHSHTGTVLIAFHSLSRLAYAPDVTQFAAPRVSASHYYESCLVMTELYPICWYRW